MRTESRVRTCLNQPIWLPGLPPYPAAILNFFTLFLSLSSIFSPLCQSHDITSSKMSAFFFFFQHGHFLSTIKLLEAVKENFGEAQRASCQWWWSHIDRQAPTVGGGGCACLELLHSTLLICSGCDIMIEMHQNGELIEELHKIGLKSALETTDDKKE